MKTTFTYDHYYKYEEIKSNLEYFAKEYPDLVTLESNVVTPEGRNQYVIAITNKKTGEACAKPALYIDGNIHAGEVMSCMAAMHTIDYLITNYGTDSSVTKLLDAQAFYVIPRVTPDGAEKYLSSPYTLRSAPRDYMTEEGGLKAEDLDQDGVVRMMRIPTPYGAWKKDPEDESIMVLRDPSDNEGEFYDIYPEGVLEEYDGDENLKRKKEDWGLDFNRNFPIAWFPNYRQAGAGKYPLSNPETKALVDFALAHTNIGGAAIGHTSGGLFLYPPGIHPEKEAFPKDMKALKAIAEMGEQELGYVKMNIFDNFVRDKNHFDSGAFDDWFFHAMGVPSYTVEFWDVSSKAGMPHKWGEEKESTADELKRFYAIMKWVKENAPQYYSDWKEYDHPTFGKVELGGFNIKFTIQNPPEDWLLKECENDTKFNIRFAKSLPRLSVDTLTAEEVSDGVYKLTAVIGNLGYLPTNLTDHAVENKLSKPVEVTLAGCEAVSGKPVEDIGNLDGYLGTSTGSWYGNITTFANAKAKKKLTWIVKAAKGSTITVTASQEKAGSAAKFITL